jgi:hypothetical protein
VDGFERWLCWVAEDQMGRTDSHDVEKECSMVRLEQTPALVKKYQPGGQRLAF